jgi:twinkle protein
MASFKDYGIKIDEMRLGKQATTCFNCSHLRKKEHQNAKCMTVVNDIGNRWFHCNHCGIGTNIDAEDKFGDLRRKHNVPTQAPKIYSPVVIKFLEKKKIRVETAQKLMWYEKTPGVLSMPYFHNYGAVRVFFRDIKHESEGNSKKTWQSTKEEGSKSVFYGAEVFNAYSNFKTINMPNLKQPMVVVLITEGQTDRATWYELGYDSKIYIVSVPSGAPPEHAKNLDDYFEFLKDDRFKDFIRVAEDQQVDYNGEVSRPIVRFFLGVDGDAVGFKLREELAKRLGRDKCWVPEYPEGIKDVNDIYLLKGKTGVSEFYNSFRPYPISGVIRLNDVKDDINNRIYNGVSRGLLCGQASFDKHVSWHENLLWVWTGVSGAGKSTVLRHYLMRLCRNNLDSRIKTSLYTPEMTPPAREYLKLMELHAEMPARANEHYRGSTLSTNAIAKKLAEEFVNEYFVIVNPTELSKEGAFVKDGNVNSLDTVLEYFRDQAENHGVRQFVIDAWNKLEHDYGKQSETNYISKSLDKILNFNSNYGVSTHIVAHPTKVDTIAGKFNNPNFRKPTLYNINGSANFKNKCMVGIVVDRKKFIMDGTKTEDNEEKWVLNKHANTDVTFEKVKFDEIGEEGTIHLSRDWTKGEMFVDVDFNNLSIPNIQEEQKTPTPRKKKELPVIASPDFRIEGRQSNYEEENEEWKF